MELSTNPSKILSNKSIDILLRITSISNASTGAEGSEIIEIPAFLSLIKNDKASNLQHTPVIISGGHYSFKSIFPTVGKYLLFVDVKDIYFTNKVLNFVFEINVTDSHMNQFYNTLESILINYYYIYIPIIGFIFVIIYWPRKKTSKQ